jgi:predicted NUDIX family NTP pyrophosphohydrolase
MSRLSAGILMYQRRKGEVFVLLVHPGGPFWRNRDLGAWSIPKGEHSSCEAPEAAARREFGEELGPAPSGALRSLGQIRQRGGKYVEAFALEGDFNVDDVHSNTFSIEWPPRSGHIGSFPEIDRAAWFALPLARQKILESQRPLLDRLEKLWEKGC